MAKVEIYTTSYCPFCHKAKALLDKKGVRYEEINVEDQPKVRMQMVYRAEGRRTVPQVFINDELVGGCDDLYALEDQGKLDTLLAE